MQNLNQSTWDHEILHAGGSLKDEKFFTKTFFVKNGKHERG
jgi:hypothetical protein